MASPITRRRAICIMAAAAASPCWTFADVPKPQWQR